MQADLISVIIPVYKVEPYLDRCVESVLQQSYRKLEVLLVDDGSPDNCGMVCDQWAEKDSRIRVIHKENGGLSDARNAGLDESNGEYIVFVDSDDYIAADMLQKLYDALIAGNADLSICNFLQVDDSGVLLDEEENVAPPISDEVLSGNEAILKMAEKGGWFYHMAWNKLYKKELFNSIRYPKGKLCEDVFVAHLLLGSCEKVACIRYAGYYYVQRAGSIMHSRSTKYYIHKAEAFLERAVYAYEHGLTRTAGRAYWKTAVTMPDACTVTGNTPQLQAEQAEILKAFRRNSQIKKCCRPKELLQVQLILLSPSLYRAVFRSPFRQKIKAKLKR